MRYTLTLLILALIISCNRKKSSKDIGTSPKNETESIDINDSQTEADADQNDVFELDYIEVDESIQKEIIEENFSDLVESNLPEWNDFLSKLSKDFNVKAFKNYQTVLLAPYQVGLLDDFNERFLKLYKPYLIWSPDSSKAIDLYSYSYILEFDTNGRIVGSQDVDCQLALIDFKDRKRIVLQTFGPSTSFHDGFWKGDDSIIVTGAGSESGLTLEPYYSLIDLNTYLSYSFEQDKKLELKECDYTMVVFKDIEFE
ncbi:hypothetical protein EYV94_10910 [Puteibacter caeruleilacunae]|nr:hypothetical protein EYV94_10910 [Puteibacter caeruleilacunae]